MGRILLLLSFFSLALLVVGTALWPQDPTFWLASNSASYQHVREVLMSVILLQLLTRPPRHVIFRFMAGAIAVSVGFWSLIASNAFSMHFMDTLGFMSAAVAVFITALERKAEDPSAYYASSTSLAVS